MIYCAFDLLVEKGADIRDLPLGDRNARLKRLLAPLGPNGTIRYTEHIRDKGGDLLRDLCRKGFEGVIAKPADAPYLSGRGHGWLKIKCAHEQEFVIGGWEESDKDRPFASILVGLHDQGGLRYAGKVGSGFSEDILADLSQRFAGLASERQPFAQKPPAAVARRSRWVRPELVAQIGFADFTRDGLVRQGRFHGLREDKPAREVRRETARPKEDAMPHAKSSASRSSGEATVAGVRLTHPDKVLIGDSNATKLVLASYLEAASRLMLPFASNRLLSLLRSSTDGKEFFFQKHPRSGSSEWIRHLEIAEKNGQKSEYLYIDDLRGLIATTQLDTVELHIWGSRIEDIEKPDRLVFDLDPGDDVPFGEVKRSAIEIRDVLAGLALQSLPLLSGGKGIHVVVPLTPAAEWSEAKDFCRVVAQRIAETAPGRYVATATKSIRHGHIFIDYLRNERGATAVAPFSPRARPGAPLAWPVDWQDLERIESAAAVRLEDAATRLAEFKAWRDYPRIQGQQRLETKSIARLRG